MFYTVNGCFGRKLAIKQDSRGFCFRLILSAVLIPTYYFRIKSSSIGKNIEAEFINEFEVSSRTPYTSDTVLWVLSQIIHIFRSLKLTAVSTDAIIASHMENCYD